MTYQLLASDLDDTLLNAKKKISSGNMEAIRRALDSDKIVLFSTGRSLEEARELLEYFPAMRYIICESGANVYDLKENKVVFSKYFEREVIGRILDYARPRDIMTQVMMDGYAILSERHVCRLDHYKITQYKKHFEKTAKVVPDVFEYCENSDWKIGKCCLYHPSVEAREETKKALEDLPVVMSYAEESMLELSPAAVDKGIGLEMLCKYLSIPVEETIVVGDSFNDLPILRKAGLSVAVANAREQVRELCDVMVTDNEHDGVREAIETYLMAE